MIRFDRMYWNVCENSWNDSFMDSNGPCHILLCEWGDDNCRSAFVSRHNTNCIDHTSVNWSQSAIHQIKLFIDPIKRWSAFDFLYVLASDDCFDRHVTMVIIDLIWYFLIYRNCINIHTFDFESLKWNIFPIHFPPWYNCTHSNVYE